MDKLYLFRTSTDEIALGIERDGIPLPTVILSKESAYKIMNWLATNLQDMDINDPLTEMNNIPLDIPPNIN